MRLGSVILAGLGISLGACSEKPVENPPPADLYAHLRIDTFDCPEPVRNAGIDYRIPALYHTRQRLSADGSRLAFLTYDHPTINVLDLRTGGMTTVGLRECLPTNVRPVTCDEVFWSPYGNDRLVVQGVTEIDTNGDRRGDVLGTNAYILNLSERTATRVTPTMYGSLVAGPNFLLLGWLVGSSPQRDSLLMHAGGRVGVLIPQDARFVPDTREHYRQSANGSRSASWEWDVVASAWRLLIDREQVPLPFDVTGIGHASWSPDGRRLALSIGRKPEDVWLYEVVAIVDVDRYLRERPPVAPVEIVDLQKRFCTYSFLGIHAEFITNRTVAVSMHKDGDPAAYVWEITTDGRQVRRLTR